MRVHFGDYKDFNDLALCLAANYNKYEPSHNPGNETKMQHKDAIHILVVYSYNWCIQYLCGRGIHKGHWQALGMSFLETARFFSGQFCDEKMTNKWHRWFDDVLAQKNGTGKKDGMTELVMVLEGIFGCFYMDTDILSSLYYNIHNQQWPIGDMPWAQQHMLAPAWKRAVDKFINETCDIILGHYHCCIVKMGQIYPGCLRLHGYIDYVFPLLPDDPHANRSLAATMAADTTAMVMHQQPQALVPAAQATPQTQAKAQPVAQPTTQSAPETTGPDVVIEEIVKIDEDDDDNEQDHAAADKESAILSMIQAYKEADAPPQAPETPCQICATPGEASAGEQSTNTEIMNAVASLSLSYPTPVETALSSQMSQ